MKYIFLLLFLLACITGYSQSKQANFVIVYRDSITAGPPIVTMRAEVFSSVAELNAWLNNTSLDSSQVIGVYNLQRNKPLSKTYKEEKQRVEVVRERKWEVKL